MLYVINSSSQLTEALLSLMASVEQGIDRINVQVKDLHGKHKK